MLTISFNKHLWITLIFRIIILFSIFITNLTGSELMYIRTFDLGGGGLKTAVYSYNSAINCLEEIIPKEQLGMCPDEQNPSDWLREKVTTLYKEIESNYFFGFSLAGFDKLRTKPFNDSDMSKVFDLPAGQVAAIDDGAAHLLSSLNHFDFKEIDVWNFSIGTGVGLAIKNTRKVLSLYEVRLLLGKDHWDINFPGTDSSYSLICSSHTGFDQLVKKNNDIIDESLFDKFADNWKTVIEEHFLQYNPSAIVFTGGHTEVYGNKLEKKLHDLGLKVATYTGPKFAGLKGAAWNVIHNYFLSNEKEIKYIKNDKDALGFTPFFKAIISKNDALIDELLEKGAPIDERDFAGQTALFYAVKDSNSTLMKKLLSKGADPKICDYWNQSVLDLARQNNNQIIIDFLTQLDGMSH